MGVESFSKLCGLRMPTNTQRQTVFIASKLHSNGFQFTVLPTLRQTDIDQSVSGYLCKFLINFKVFSSEKKKKKERKLRSTFFCIQIIRQKDKERVENKDCNTSLSDDNPVFASTKQCKVLSHWYIYLTNISKAIFKIQLRWQPTLPIS